MKNLGTFYLSAIRRALPSIPLFAYKCPKCSKIEFVEVEE